MAVLLGQAMASQPIKSNALRLFPSDRRDPFPVSRITRCLPNLTVAEALAPRHNLIRTLRLVVPADNTPIHNLCRSRSARATLIDPSSPNMGSYELQPSPRQKHMLLTVFNFSLQIGCDPLSFSPAVRVALN